MSMGIIQEKTFSLSLLALSHPHPHPQGLHRALEIFFLHHDGARPRGRQITHFNHGPISIISRRVRSIGSIRSATLPIRPPDQLPRNPTHNARRLKRQRLQVQSDGDQAIFLNAPEQGILGAEIRQQALLQEQRGGVGLGEGQAEKTRLVDEAFGQAELEAHFVDREAGGVVAPAGALDQLDVRFDFGDYVALL